MFSDLLFEPYLRLVFAVIVGGGIGLDRAFRGRAAGFRTHILVCLASCLLMVMSDFQWANIPNQLETMIRVDPARMAQGVMTGIGFLGAGAMMQDKNTVRGLTTAASIWITAAIGLVIGGGFYITAIFAALLTLITLAIFNLIVETLPLRHYALLVLRFSRRDYWSELQVREVLTKHSLVVSNFSFKLSNNGKNLSYQMTVRTSDLNALSMLADDLLAADLIKEFSLRPMGD